MNADAYKHCKAIINDRLFIAQMAQLNLQLTTRNETAGERFLGCANMSELNINVITIN